MLKTNKFVKNFASRETSWLERVEMLSWLGVLVFIFVPTKHIIYGHTELLTGSYSDFTAIVLYASMVLLLIFLLIGLYKEILLAKNWFLAKVLAGMGVVGILYYFRAPTDQLVLETYFYLKLSCAFLFGYLVYKSNTWLKYKDFLLWTIVILGALNALAALLQFLTQASLGLNLLGESPLSLDGFGVAKVVTHGTVYLRSYGFFAHANILGGVLVIVSLLNLYLLNKTTQTYSKLLLWLCFCLISAGIFVSLSRGAIFSFGLSLMLWSILNLHVKTPQIYKKLGLIAGWLIVLVIALWPFLYSRATWNDSATSERGIFNHASTQIIGENWLTGTGPGTNLIAMNGALSEVLEPWLIQPIHNFALINIAELGLIGLILFILILYILGSILRKTLSSLDPPSANLNWLIALSSISVAVFSLFWFDHYFHTIWPAQLLLWMFLGLAWREIKNPNLVKT